MHFCHLLEQHGLGHKLFEQMPPYLQRHSFKLGYGADVDATLISAPFSTTNKDQQRGPDMHQTKKSKQWYFGTHIGDDSRASEQNPWRWSRWLH